MMKPRISFPCYVARPGGLRLGLGHLNECFWTVHVWNSLKGVQMQPGMDDQTLGCCSCNKKAYRRAGHIRRNEVLALGTIHLSKTHVGSEVVSHEACHAAYRTWLHYSGWFFRRKATDLNHIKIEEALCWLEGWYMRQIVQHLYDAGLLK